MTWVDVAWLGGALLVNLVLVAVLSRRRVRPVLRRPLLMLLMLGTAFVIYDAVAISKRDVTGYLNGHPLQHSPRLFVVLVVIIAIAICFSPLWTFFIDTFHSTHHKRVLRSSMLMFTVFGTASLVLIGLFYFGGDDRWLWAAALIPMLIVFQYAMQLAIFKNRGFIDGTRMEYEDLDKISNSEIARTAKDAWIQDRKYHSTESLALRFLLPALFLGFAIIMVGYVLKDPPPIADLKNPHVYTADFFTGARLGAAGAYLFVLLFLGGRAVKSDITTSSVVWSTVTIVAGPALAGIVEISFLPSVKPEGTEPAVGALSMVVPFAAGFSMDLTIDFVAKIIRRVFGSEVVVDRTMSLTNVRGISRDIADRLAEEGVSNIANLASANPHRLRRNTRYDKRQILTWIDEALLIVHFPQAWQRLEEGGFVGASRLLEVVGKRSCVCKRLSESSSADTPTEPSATATETAKSPCDKDPWKALSETLKTCGLEGDALCVAISRLCVDDQVKLIGNLFKLDDVEFEELGGGRSLIDELSPEIQMDVPFASVQIADARLPNWQAQHGLNLVHWWRRSPRPERPYDVLVKLVRDDRLGASDAAGIERVEYNFGPGFYRTEPDGIHRVKDVENITSKEFVDDFAVRVFCSSSLFCVARVIWKKRNGEQTPTVVELTRYIDVGSEILQPISDEGEKLKARLRGEAAKR